MGNFAFNKGGNLLLLFPGKTCYKMGKLKLADAEEFWQCADEDGNGILSIVELRHAVIKYAKSKGQPIPCQNAIKVNDDLW